MKTWLLFPLVALLVVGCATPKPRPAALTQVDIVAMVKAKMTDEDIMRRIDATGTVFNLSADDVVKLRQEGVSERLVDYMLDTKVRAAAEYERHRYYYYDPYYYGPLLGLRLPVLLRTHAPLALTGE